VTMMIRQIKQNARFCGCITLLMSFIKSKLSSDLALPPF
jgi:hypothetical protein